MVYVDTMHAFLNFYSFYNNLFFHGEMNHWIPYGAYGVPGHLYHLMHISGMTYLLSGIGWLLRVENVLLLFDCALFLDQLVLLFGTYLLARLLFANRITVLFVTFGLICSVTWRDSAFLNLRLFYCWPFVLYFLVLFFLRVRAYYLWLSGITLVFSLIGNVVYYAPLYLFILCVLCVVLLREKKYLQAIRECSARNLVPFLVLVLITGMYLYCARHAMDFTVSFIEGRDQSTAATPIDTFVTHGALNGIKQKLLMLIYSGPTFGGNPLYIGLLPLVFLIYGFMVARGPIVKSFALTLGILFCFSLGDTTFVARTAYQWVPMMPLFRYIGRIHGILKLFLILLAGYGLDIFLNRMRTHLVAGQKRRSFHPLSTPNLTLYIGGFLLATMAVVDIAFNRDNHLSPGPWQRFYFFSAFTTALAIGLVGLRRHKSVAGVGTIVLLCFGLDMLSFQNLAALEPAKVPPDKSDLLQVRPLPFWEQRSSHFQEGTKERLAADLVSAGICSITTDSSFMQADPASLCCLTITKGVDNLLRVRGGDPAIQSVPLSDPSFLHAIGCASPKLRLMSDAIFADTKEQATQIVRENPDLSRWVVLRGVKSEASGSPEDSEAKGSIHVTHFSSNELIAETNWTGNRDAWLVYADAFHPGWRAWVNGTAVEIAEANLAFKAVKVKKGHSTVRFAFVHRPTTIAIVLLVALSVVIASLLLGFFCVELFSSRSDKSK